MAIKSEYPDGTGFDLFDAWSQGAAEGYSSRDTRSTWQSVKAGGGVAIGTLLQMAKSHGFTLPKGRQAPAAPSAQELARRERDRAAQAQTDKLRTEAAHVAAAAEALALWLEASETGASPYLERKGVQGHGVRFAAGGWLLVPLRDAEGMLCNLQRIAPARPQVGPVAPGGRSGRPWRRHHGRACCAAGG
jgi:putative DNA primase/helicase